MFAGQIAESLGWRWGFWMIVPVAAGLVHRQLARAAARRHAARGASRLARVHQPFGRHRRGAARVLARAAARLVREPRDHHRHAGGRARALRVLRAQPDERTAVRAPQAAGRPQLQSRADARHAVRHAQLRHRRADAAAAAAARRLSRFRHRRDRRLPRHGLRHRLPAGDAHGAARSAHQPRSRRLAAGQHRHVDDELRPQRRHEHAAS